ncbi:MAG: DNA recombination protein RmuC [Sulfurospirillaceae bacterium]|nr:DNA recombination protein RmuC [Sulfurospirillaceae bacterium]
MEQNTLFIIIFTVLGIIIFGLVFMLLSIKKRLEKEQNSTRESLESLSQENNELKIQNSVLNSNLEAINASFEKMTKDSKDLQEQILNLSSEKSKAEARLQAQAESNERLKEDFEEQSKKLELKLNEIMQHNLDSKIKKFDETSLKSMDNILKPFKENLDDFKKKIESSQENSTMKFAALSKEIEQVTKAGMHIGKEAENLTRALKGKKQTQGSWGEMILERVLEYSGLQFGTDYTTQESYKDDAGKTKRPDVVIKLPQERSIIIDSKVSLNDYDNYIRAESDEERTISAKAVVTAFKNHIDTLDSKDYAHYQTGTLQYVFMFVPIEGAFSLAVQENPNLYEYALDKHIAIVNPSTLTISLRTIYLYWQSEKSSSNALQMFNTAGKLYDKMVNFAENFSKIGTQLQTVTRTFEKAEAQLSNGSGNLMKRVEDLKSLGAKTTKSLKNKNSNYRDFDDEEVEIELIEEKDNKDIEVEED